MSIYGDIRMEASARKRGAPTGPTVRPRLVRDEDGTMYTIYPGKACAAPGCPVLELTSRNRYGKKTLCIEHGRAADRNRGPRSAEQIAAAKVRRGTKAAAAPIDPQRDRLHNIFRGWLQHPEIESLRDVLIAAMDEYELMARLRRLIPAAAASGPVTAPTRAPLSIPVEDPTDSLTNPNHRSTRSEFLADADHYGA